MESRVFKRFALMSAAVLLAMYGPLMMYACNQRPTPSSSTPAADVDPNSGQPLGATATLRTNQIRTRYLIDGAVTAGKIGSKVVAVNVALGAATGSSAADPDLVGGTLTSCKSAGNQDQFMDNVVLNGDGSITVTLAANAVAINNFTCFVLKANTKGIS